MKRSPSLALCVALVAAMAATVGAPMTAIAAEPRTEVFDAAIPAGIHRVSRDWETNVVDFDRDGILDLIYGGHMERPLELLLGNGTSGFAPSPTARFPPMDRHSCAWNDVNADGLTDGFCSMGADFGNGVKSNELWVQQPDGTVLDLAPEYRVSDPYGRSRAATFIDVNHDGLPDLYSGTLYKRGDGLPSPNRLYINTGTGFRDAPEYGLNLDVNSLCAQAADFDGDGWEDLLTCSGAPRLYRNNAGRSFTRVASVAPKPASIGPAAARLADLNGDGHRDLIWVGKDQAFVQTQTPSHTFAPAVVVASLSTGYGVATGDFNGDSLVDIYIVQRADDSSIFNQPDILLLQRAGGGYDRATIPQAAYGAGGYVTALDYDRDGGTDFVVMNGDAKLAGRLQLLTAKRCTILGTEDADTLVGTEEADVICGFGGDDSITGLGGNDTIAGGLGNDIIDAGGGNDIVLGGDGTDLIDGGADNDHIVGGPGADTELGGPGADTHDQGNQADGGDTIGDAVSGPGDAVYYSGRFDPVAVSIGAGTADDGALGEGDDVGASVTRVFGGAGADVLAGGPLADYLDGGPGGDQLFGGEGNDTLRGGGNQRPGEPPTKPDGTDNLDQDVEDGGPGDDTFDQGWIADGSDSFIGGDGTDALDYSLRVTPTAELTSDDGLFNDGRADERDEPQSMEVALRVPVVMPAAVAMEPHEATPVGTPVTFAALVTDPDDMPMPNVPVTFRITGANAALSWAAVTGQDGIARYTYAGKYGGDDSVLAEPYANARSVNVVAPKPGATVQHHWIAPDPTINARPTVSDAGFSPAIVTGTSQPVGVEWHNTGTTDHGVRDKALLGANATPLFSSGPLVAGGKWAHVFMLAGRFVYVDSLVPTNTGSVAVPFLLDRRSGTRTTRFVLTLAQGTPPAGVRFDVQVTRPKTSTWANLATSATGSTFGFTPDKGAGTYKFRVRVHTTTNRVSGWSPINTINVT